METQSLRKTFKYKLKPTPEQERELDRVLWTCRELYNTALEQRKTAYERCGVSLSRYTQEAELKELRAAFPEYAAIHAMSCKTCSRDWTKPSKPSSDVSSNGKRARRRAIPASTGASATTPSPTRSSATARRWIMGSWCSPRLAGLPFAGVVRWRARPRRSRSRGKRMVGMSASPVPTCRCSRCRPLDKRPA